MLACCKQVGQEEPLAWSAAQIGRSLSVQTVNAPRWSSVPFFFVPIETARNTAVEVIEG
jgi:hypothetical protein